MTRRATAARLFGGLLVIAIACGIALAGCSGASYNLNRDKSLSTAWGTILQYKVDDTWVEHSSDSNKTSDSFASVGYSNENEDGSLYVSVTVENTNSSLWKYSSEATYGDWLDSREEYYSRSAEEQAAWYKENMSDYSGYDEERAKAESYPDYKNYKMSEAGSFDIDGVSFRLYKMTYTISYSDAAWSKLKERHPDANVKQTSDYDIYYAVVKDGSHDAVISASDERLLKDFLKTLQIKW